MRQTSVEDILQLGLALAKGHNDRAALGQPAYASRVLLTDADTWQPLLAEVFRGFKAEFINAADAVDGVEAGCDPRTALPDLVAKAESLAEILGLGVTLVVDEEFVHWESSQPLDASNTAHQVLVGVLTSVFDPALRKAPLSALMWEESALDVDHARPVASFLLDLPVTLGLGDGSTLVLLAADTRLNVERHCVGPGSVEFDVGPHGLVVRQTHAQSMTCVAHTTRLAPERAPAVILVLGAGAVTHLGLPTGNDLRDDALASYLGDEATGLDVEEQARLLFNQLANSPGDRLRESEVLAGIDAFVENLTLERVLREERFRENVVPTSTLVEFARTHEAVLASLPADRPPSALARLVRLQARLILVTVNFDRTLENEVGDAIRPFVTAEDFEGVGEYLTRYLSEGGPVPYLKLHGDISIPETVVANVDETESGLSEVRLAALTTLRDLAGPVHPWSYIGYSMRDLDLNRVFATDDFADPRIEYWIAPTIDTSVRRFIQEHRLLRWEMRRTRYNVENRCITLTAEEYMTLLAEAWGV